MRGSLIPFCKRLLIGLLMVGVLSSATFRGIDHGPLEIVQTFVEHQAEIEAHGHAHESIFDLIHHAHGHLHDGAEHDHTVLFTPPSMNTVVSVRLSIERSLANEDTPDRTTFSLERPPRV